MIRASRNSAKRNQSEDQQFLRRAKAAHVYKVAVAYAVVSRLLIQIATQVFPFLEIPN